MYLQTTLTVFDPLRQELRDEIMREAFNRMAVCLRVRTIAAPKHVS
jgi:hypothetical protein